MYAIRSYYATTALDGSYSFSGVAPGSYVVVQTNAANHSSVTDSDGDTADPAANQIAVTLTAGGSSTGNNFLDIADAGTIAGSVTLDADRDGASIGDAEDTALSGITVELFANDGSGNPTGSALASTITALDGSYVITSYSIHYTKLYDTFTGRSCACDNLLQARDILTHIARQQIRCLGDR